MNKFKKFCNNVISGISAGIIIGIATTMYVVCPNKIVGAFLFSFGLMAICILRQTLYTGAIGYVFIKQTGILSGLLGNALGVCGISLLIRAYSQEIHTASNTILVGKLEVLPIKMFISAIICGMLMFIAVEIFNRTNDSVLGIITAVPCFIICGFDHCIVNMYHLTMANSWYEFVIGTMVVSLSLIGNSLGAMLMFLLLRKRFN